MLKKLRTESTLDKILKCKNSWIQHVNRCREMDLTKVEKLQTVWIQKLTFYDLVGVGGSVGDVAMVTFVLCSGPSYSQCYILLGPQLQSQSYPLLVLATTNVIFCWGPSYSLCDILLGPQSYSVGALATANVILVGSQLQPILYSIGALATASVIFWWGPSCSHYILFGPQLQPVLYSVGILATVTFLSCSGPSYNQCHILLEPQLQSVSFCWGPRYSHCHILLMSQVDPLSYCLGHSYSQCHSVGALAVSLPFCWGPKYTQCLILPGPLSGHCHSGGSLGTCTLILVHVVSHLQLLLYNFPKCWHFHCLLFISLDCGGRFTTERSSCSWTFCMSLC